ncbi:MAG: glycosyltransferase family 2 protein [Candidatus Kapabacteria bacterium]|nr:glycosyltransferase family 2 protein [Candidatus Kapabacteria bacterium]
MKTATKATISIIILAKNNEATIGRAINSMKELVTQIVVVDTGSTDNTVAICTRLGAEVHFYKWVNDFSATRNYALRLCRCNWVIILDSDEAIELDSIKEHLELLKNPNNHAINVRLINIMKDSDSLIETEHRYTRIFRNNPAFKFTGTIHEQIRPSIEEAGYDIIDTEIKIYHYGYSSNQREKGERNREMLLNEIKMNPGDDWLKYHLAETEFALANNDEAYRLYNQITDSAQLSADQIQRTLIRLAQICLANDQYAEINHWLAFNSDDNNLEGMRLYILATTKLMQRDYEAAKTLFLNPLVEQSVLVNKANWEKAVDLVVKILENDIH